MGLQKKSQATLVGGAVQGDHLVVELLPTVLKQQLFPINP